MIAWGQDCELGASKPQPQEIGHVALFVPPRFGGEAAKSRRDKTYWWFAYLGFHEYSLSLGSFTPGYHPTLLRSYEMVEQLYRYLCGTQRLKQKSCIETNASQEGRAVSSGEDLMDLTEVMSIPK